MTEKIIKTIRLIYLSDEYKRFYNELDEISKSKVDKIINHIGTNKVLSQNVVKKLKGSKENSLYEIIVKSTNKREYRIISIGILDDIFVNNIIESDEILLLNGFLKKSNKDYPPAMRKADSIVNDYFSE